MPDIFGPIDSVYKQMYSENVALAIQQGRNVYEGLYTPMSVSGRQMQAVELVGTSEVIFDEAAKAPTPDIEPKHIGVHVQPRKYHWGRIVTNEATLKANVDYTGTYVQESAKAFLRGRARVIRDALFGPRLVLATGSALPTAVPFDAATRTVAVNYAYGGGGSNSGLTVAKFVKALERLGWTDLDIDAESIVMTMSMKQNTDLYQALQVTSKDFGSRAVFEDKFVRRFMGVDLVIDNALPYQSGVIRQCMMWAKSGLHWGPAVPLTTNIERNVAVQMQPHIYAEEWSAATRSEDDKFSLVLCDETPAGA